MIRNPDLLEQAELDYEREHPLTLEQKYSLLEAMYQHAKSFGHFKPEGSLQGIEDDIALAKALNANLSVPPANDRGAF